MVKGQPMAPRKDIHRPSVLVVADYEFVAYDYYGSDGSGLAMAGERKLFREHMARSGGKFSSHEHSGSCHVCGAGALFVGKFWHRPSNQYVVLGEDCSRKMEMGNPAAFKSFRKAIGVEREAIAGKSKAKGVLEAAGLGKAWELYEAEAAYRKEFAAENAAWQEANPEPELISDRTGYGVIAVGAPKFKEYSRDELTALDIVGRLVKWGSISDKAASFLGSLLERIEKAPELAAEKAAAKALELANASPVPVVAGRVLVTGEVLTVRQQEGFYGVQIKMLVKASDGWKVWGTVPSALVDEVEKGSVVEFSAAIKPSDDDKYFGFFSRPSKAKVIKALAA
jgi:hypothetical protein